MKKIRSIISLLIIVILGFTAGCDGLFKCGGDFSFIGENLHYFELYDYATGVPLLGIYGQYYRDTVNIHNADGRVYYDGPVANSGRIAFSLVNNDDRGTINQQIARELYLYLNYQDTDTLRYEFTMKKNECDNQVYKHTKLVYNDSVYIDDFNERFRFVKLYKK